MRVVSLRVPGVDFPEAELVLGARPVEQVDDVAARGEFWRWRVERPETNTPEAYLWGLRSTVTARALWMLLLPFTLINVAYWARPTRPRGVMTWLADSTVGNLCRALALTLTATLTLGVAGVTMDLIAWQCLSSGTGCADSWPKPFNLVGELRLSTYDRLAVGALAPLLVLGVLWAASLRTWRRYERRAEIDLPPDELTAARFWRGRDWVRRLRAVHLIVGMAMVDALLVYPIARVDRAADRAWWVAGALLLGLLAVALLVGVVGSLVPLPVAIAEVRAVRNGPVALALRQRLAAGARLHDRGTDRVERGVAAFRRRAHALAPLVSRAVRLSAWCAVIVTAAGLLYAVGPRRSSAPSEGALPGFAAGVATLSAVQVALLVALALATLPLCWIARRTARRLAWRGFVAPVMAAVATMLAVAETASLLYFAALSIGQLETSDAGRAWLPAPPYPYEWAGLVFTVGMGAVVLAVAFGIVRWNVLLGTGRRMTDERDRDLRRRRPDAAEVLDHAHARGQLLESMPALAMIVFVPIAALSVVGVVYSALGRGPAALLPNQSTLTNLGAWSIGLAALLLVLTVARAGNTTPGRRLVSAVYAMATFWPRAAHPFAAPAHGPRAVADIVRRVTTLTDQGVPVVLAGHSHGSVLAAMAVRNLPAGSLPHIALLTSACPVTRLIEPFFAAFFDREVSVKLATALTDADGTRWTNLYRTTDPIGGAVCRPDTADTPLGAVDELAPDPPDQSLRDLEPQVGGHGSYLHDPAFVAAHDRLVTTLAHRHAAPPPPRRRTPPQADGDRARDPR
ncbi:hypothetical protein [Asanoa iriomotensis]|uniref:Integral membrane protein n=1 Tax=Asanoa iriomotensis TaxID=234613 RepID=A0ABQ4C439_9ACTN|nr:hypothetical protein [Asanoa iriomotensis]GIF57055.1 hypothetical protein Air01nite_31500 [Asanoa iriomotensis]